MGGRERILPCRNGEELASHRVVVLMGRSWRLHGHQQLPLLRGRRELPGRVTAHLSRRGSPFLRASCLTFGAALCRFCPPLRSPTQSSSGVCPRPRLPVTGSSWRRSEWHLALVRHHCKQ